MSTVARRLSNSDSISENAVGNASLRSSDADTPMSDYNAVHSKFEGQRVLEGHDDSFSCVRETDEHANIKSGLVKLPPSKSTDSTDVLNADPPTMDLKSMEKNDDMEVEIQGTNDSEVVLQDVKVCDICGDAGREDSLAICCQCSDGAEHTYCMRKMLDEVPEVNWLCEECKSAGPVGYGKQEKFGKVDNYENNDFSGHASSDVSSSEAEGIRIKSHTKRLGKRLRDDAEVSSVVKKPALESIVGSPKTSVSSKTAALSQDYSSKNLDKGRLQPSLHSSDGSEANYAPESSRTASDQREKKFRGTFSKSNSFNSLNLKPKIKLVDQVVLRRQKSAREHVSSFRLKDHVARSIDKSMSFKSVSSVRSGSKIETLSPRMSHGRDLKSTKQRSSFERQSSFETEHPSINGASLGSTPRIDKKLSSWDVPSSFTASTNHPEMKPVPDGKSAALLRSSSFAARRNADLSSSSGEFKRPSLHGTVGGSLANGVNNIQQKYNQISPKEAFSSCSSGAETPSFNVSEGELDKLSQMRDIASSGEQTKDTSGKYTRDESDNLKVALQAAALRKPGVYRKHKALGQSDDSSAPGIGCEIASHQDRMPNSDGKKNICSAEMPERLIASRNLTSQSVKLEALDHAKPFSLVPKKGFSSARVDDFPVVPLDDKTSFGGVPAAMPFFFKSFIIPEHEYIWQGSFEICQSGKIADSWDGIQAHLSTGASPKVIEAVNKFKSKILLSEVPRLSTWPMHFQEHGVKEDNIALFFFAKNLQSYEKRYKVMLDNMMKNDLALRGNIDGIELLIFPSNQLPDKAQRWNRLFFLCAVFRGKKESCSQPMPEFVKQISAPRDFLPAIMSSSESTCSIRPVAQDLPALENVARVPKGLDPEKLCSLLSSKAAVYGDCNTKIPSLDQLDSKLHNSSSAAVKSGGGKQWQELRDTFLKRGRNSSSWGPPRLQALRSTSDSVREKMPAQLNTSLDKQQSFNKYPAAITHNMAPKEDISERTRTRGISNHDEIRLNASDRNAIDLNIEAEDDVS